VLLSILRVVLLLVFLYPFAGSIAWSIGGLIYRFIYRGKVSHPGPPAPEDQPLVTILIPAHDEELVIEKTIDYLFTELNYDNFEVLVCNDGSNDRTTEILEGLMQKYPQLRSIHIMDNKGKAHAFNVAFAFARGEFILSNDADTLPERDAIWKYLDYFKSPRYQNTGAVTGNMDVLNRNKLIEKSQTVEFSSIVGIIKRTQMSVLGSMYAYSGANTMYRKSAVQDVAGFRQDRATEDISIAWDQQFQGWQALFAPEIFFYMMVPDSLKMLFNQRKRWAKGGTESFFTNVKRIIKHPWRNISQVVMLLDQLGSISWSFLYVFGTILFVIQVVYQLIMGRTGTVEVTFDTMDIFLAFMAFVGFWQVVVALVLDRSRHKLRYVLFAPLYLLLFWQINTFTVVWTFIPALKAVYRGEGEGTWISPKRVSMG